MSTRMLWILMAKDLRLHGLPLLLMFAAVLSFLGLVIRFVPSEASPVGFVTNINVFITLAFSEWLIARERSTRSFAWLRSLPVDDRTLVLGKFLLASACGTTLWTVSTGLFARQVWQSRGEPLVTLCALAAFGALCVATRWRVNWHLAHMVPIGILAAFLLPGLLLAREGTLARAALIAFWNAPYGPPLMAAGLLLIYLGIVWNTIRWAKRADTWQLVD